MMKDFKDHSEGPGRTARRNGQDMLCPKCRKPLVVGHEGDAEADYCESCRGVWVEFFDERKLLNIKPEIFSIDELRRLRKLYQPLPPEEKVGYVPCPVCHELMNRRNWGSHSGVIVDRCREHGTWYDNKELDKIREYIALGGIEYEKFQLTEQGLSDLDVRLLKESQKLNEKIDSAYRRARIYSILGL